MPFQIRKTCYYAHLRPSLRPRCAASGDQHCKCIACLNSQLLSLHSEQIAYTPHGALDYSSNSQCWWGHIKLHVCKILLPSENCCFGNITRIQARCHLPTWQPSLTLSRLPSRDVMRCIHAIWKPRTLDSYGKSFQKKKKKSLPFKIQMTFLCIYELLLAGACSAANMAVLTER